MVKIPSRPVPQKICAIDASTNSLAFAIFNGEKLITFGKINFVGNNVYQKVGDAAKKTIELFKLFDIEAIVIEHTVFVNSPKTVADLALVQGAMLGSASINKIKLAGSVNPITWQSFIGNKQFSKEEKLELMKEYPNKTKNWYSNKMRELRKLKTIRFINMFYDININDNDVADAIGIGHWAIRNWKKVDK